MIAAAWLAAIGCALMWAVQLAMLPMTINVRALKISSERQAMRTSGRASRVGSLFIWAPSAESAHSLTKNQEKKRIATEFGPTVLAGRPIRTSERAFRLSDPRVLSRSRRLYERVSGGRGATTLGRLGQPVGAP